VNNGETCATFSQRFKDAKRIKDFESKLNAVKWDINDSNTNFTYINFSNTYINLYDECFPVVTKYRKRFRSNTKPWFTTALNKSDKRKAILYRKWICSHNTTDFEKYEKYKNKLTSLLSLSEMNYYISQFAEIEGHLKNTETCQIWAA